MAQSIFDTTTKQRIVGIGSALIDILINASDEFVSLIGATKGGMIYVENTYIDNIINQTDMRPKVVPGGSACNTLIGIGKLGGKARFVGKLGEDEYGRLFRDSLIANNVEPLLITSPSPTGRVLSVITPDAERSMLTCLGASAETQPEEINTELFENTAITLVEGYQLFNQDLTLAILKAAKAADVLIALDLASFTVVEEAETFLKQIVADYVDILVANEDEARAFTGYADEDKAIRALAQTCQLAVLKLGARGSVIAHKSQFVEVSAMQGDDIIDTTGAGDLWASGFLYGLVNGFSLEKCGQIGSACGYEVCRVIGANIPDAGWKRIKALL